MDSVFIRKDKSKFKTYPLGYRMKPQAGSVGIEIEVEGNLFRKGEEYGHGTVGRLPLPKPWTFHNDGSLRGQDNAEYVTNGPIPFNGVEDAVNTLWKMFEEDGTRLDESNRTSVHVHLNIQKFHLNRLCSLLVLYFSVEELLTAFCGEHRVGNLFCLRAKDATAIITRLKEYFREHGSYRFSDGMHYCGLNPQAIHKLGSVEIRTLRGATEPDLIINWVSVLQRLYELSEEYPNPQNIIDMFSKTGPMGYLEFILGPHTQMIIEGSGYSVERANNSMYDGIRLVQELCYCVPWEDYEGIEVRLDPFQRQIPPVSQALNISDVSYHTTFPIGSPGLIIGESPTPPPPQYTFDDYATMEQEFAEVELNEDDYNEWLTVQDSLNAQEEGDF